MVDVTNTQNWSVQQLANLESSAPSTGSLFGPGEPIMNGLAAETFDPAVGGGISTNLTSGTLYAAKMLVTDPCLVSKMLIDITTVGTVTHAFLALLDLAGNELATTADFEASWTATGTLPVNLAAAATLKPGFILGALLVTWSGQAAVLGVTAHDSSGANANLGTAASRALTLGASLTALPVSPVTLSSGTPDALTPWIGVV